jgi:hypothetical protein
MAPDVRRLVVPHEHASNRASEPAGDAVAVLDVRVVHRPRRRLRARAQAAHPAARVEGGRARSRDGEGRFFLLAQKACAVRACCL